MHCIHVYMCMSFPAHRHTLAQLQTFVSWNPKAKCMLVCRGGTAPYSTLQLWDVEGICSVTGHVSSVAQGGPNMEDILQFAIFRLSFFSLGSTAEIRVYSHMVITCMLWTQTLRHAAPTHFRPVFQKQWVPVAPAVLWETQRYAATLKEDQKSLMLGPQITFGEWFHNKRNIYFSLKDLLRIKLELFYGKFSYSVSGTGCPENKHPSSYHQNVSILTWNTNLVPGVVLCLWSVANASQRGNVLVYGTQVKSTELSSAAFAFAGKGNNYSICFASKMGIANVFLTSLRGKNHTQYG